MAVHRRAPSAPASLAALALVLACSAPEGGAEGEAGPDEVVDASGRPEVEVPDGEPPDSLTIEEITEGDGDEVVEGTMVTLHYVGITFSGDEFASSWERGQPLVYEHGQGRWVEGWEAGLEGMRPGGRRRIVVPPELGYGDRGAPGVAPGEALVFVVDLLDVG